MMMFDSIENMMSMVHEKFVDLRNVTSGMDTRIESVRASWDSIV